MNSFDRDFYNFKRKYNYSRRRGIIDTIIGMILIALLTVMFFAVRNFIRDMNKLEMWDDGLRSIAILILTNIVLYALSFANNNYDIFFWGLGISFTMFCIYWHMVLNPKNKLYDAAMWEENQNWWRFDGWEFEKEVGRLFEACGYRVQVTKGSGDGGVDVILYGNGLKTIVQCKHHRNPVPPEPVEDLWNCMQNFSADEAVFIASSGYTSGCYDFVSDKPNYKLLTLDDLSLLAAQVHGRLDKLNQKNAFLNNENTKLALPVYLLICSIILSFIYVQDYKMPSESAAPAAEEKVINEDGVKNQTPEELAVASDSEKSNDSLEPSEPQIDNGEAAKTVGVDSVNNVDFGPYMREIERRIKRNWNPPKGNESRKVVVLFTVGRDGRLLSVKTLKSSGSVVYDRAAQKAVELTAPFRSLPSEYKNESVDIEFTFDYNVIKRDKNQGY